MGKNKCALVVTCALLIGCATYILWLLRLIHLYGEVIVYEPNLLILRCEIGAYISIIAWGIWCLRRKWTES